MIAKLAWRALLRGKARFACAALGVAAATAAVTFMASLAATNKAQGPALAARALAALPVADGAETLDCTVDFRPGGRVMQGPPMRATLATDPALDGDEPCVAVTKAMFGFRARGGLPPIGDKLTFVGRKGVMTAKIVRVVDVEKVVRGMPTAFVNAAARKAFGREEWKAYAPPDPEKLGDAFMTDGGRNVDRAQALLLWAAALTALCLLVNSLFLAIESNRRALAVLRIVGMTRAGVAKIAFAESFLSALFGAALGVALGLGALAVHVAHEAATFPAGLAVSVVGVAGCAGAAVLVALAAAAIALRPALAVRPLEAASVRPPKPRRLGMAVAFACGFGAFVAVETWGASLMRAFVPSAEWPDAIVSLLPAGVDSADVLKLARDGKTLLRGVKRVHELAPLQAPFEPLEEMKGPGAGRPPPGGRGPAKAWRNALLLASDRLPPFKLVEGTRADVERGVFAEGGCVITKMMATARGLKLGDKLALNLRGEIASLPIVGVVDLNWHMVTSRGLLRGLNRMPVFTDGPAFISFDTLDAIDPRPEKMVRMTHLWLDYEDEFLKEHGVFRAGRLVEGEIAAALGHPKTCTVRLHARDEVADGTLAHGDQLIGSMARIPYVFLAVLSLGFVAMLVAVAEARKREYAVLRAVGATRAQLVARLAGEALRTACWGVAAGFPGGALAGWLFAFVTRAAMANWGIPAHFAVPSATVAQGALGAVAMAIAVAVPASVAIVGRLTRRRG
ncbi:MAG: ABC transporter permease [Kiritimatiellae bacterium]|nr:ABC transporter permease [Kiritimatiellia bacterium]